MPLSPFLLGLRKNIHLFLFGLGATGILVLLGTLLYVRSASVMEDQLKDKLKSIAKIAALDFDAKDLDALRTQADWKRPQWGKVVRRLIAIRESSPDIVFAYILRQSPADRGRLEFVADSHSLNPTAVLDLDDNGVIDEADELIYPGFPYDEAPPEAFEGLYGPTTNTTVYADQWGAVISGYAPILDDDGKPVAIMAVDIRAGGYQRLTQSVFSPFAFIVFVLAGLLVAGYSGLVVWMRRVDALKRINDERTGLMILTSHQLGAPLTLFKYSLGILEDRDPAEPLERAVAEHITVMKEAILRMNDILDDLKQANQVEEGRVEYRPEWTSLGALIAEAVRQFDGHIRSRNQKVELFLDKDLKAKLDRKLIGDVLHELIGNAIDYSPEGAIITIWAKRIGAQVQVEVQDRGCGIPEADLPRIFTKFVRAANARNFKADGNGLGLYISRGLVRQGGGDMWVRSEEGKGTSVFFTLPVGE